MAAKSFLRMVAGRTREIFGIVVSAGAGNDGDLVALDASGRLDNSVMPVGIGADTKSIQASENLAAGDLVNIWTSGGARVRKADASTSGKEANGFVLAAVTSGQNATVYFEGTITGLSGLTIGARYYVSAASPGAATATAPSGSGNVVQYVGVAVSATEISFEHDDGVILA